MQNYPNIEASAFRKGAYVGYATYHGKSVVYHITRNGKAWEAKAIGWITLGTDAPRLMQKTLRAMSDSLSDLSVTP